MVSGIQKLARTRIKSKTTVISPSSLWKVENHLGDCPGAGFKTSLSHSQSFFSKSPVTPQFVSCI